MVAGAGCLVLLRNRSVVLALFCEARTVLSKHENAGKRRCRFPLPALHALGLPSVIMWT